MWWRRCGGTGAPRYCAGGTDGTLTAAMQVSMPCRWVYGAGGSDSAAWTTEGTLRGSRGGGAWAKPVALMCAAGALA